jgi:ABC-type thiamine transport system ATPase subunit
LSIDPLTAAGGGVVAVAAFALRISCIMLARPPVRRLLVLDEPFVHVSADLRPKVRELVQALADDLDFQFLIVSHAEDLVAGKVVRI